MAIKTTKIAVLPCNRHDTCAEWYFISGAYGENPFRKINGTSLADQRIQTTITIE
jgi:hypothetical protein